MRPTKGRGSSSGVSSGLSRKQLKQHLQDGDGGRGGYGSSSGRDTSSGPGITGVRPTEDVMKGYGSKLDWSKTKGGGGTGSFAAYGMKGQPKNRGAEPQYGERIGTDRVEQTVGGNRDFRAPMTRGGGMMGDPYYYGGGPGNREVSRRPPDPKGDIMAKYDTETQDDSGNTGAKDPGSYNYQQIMDDFYKYEPDENDAEGRSYKLGLAGDMISKGFDSDLSEKMAYTQAGISKDMMGHQANLDMRNQSEARKQEFDYGMQSMGAQFEHQNNFANSQYDRDVGMLAATGEQDRMNITATGQQNRLGEIVKGEQSRLNIGAQGQQDRQNITTQQAAQGKREKENISTQQIMQGAREQANIGAQGTQDRANIRTQQQAQGDREVQNIREQGDSDRASITTQQQTQGEREKGNITTQGEQDRQSIGTQGDVDVRKIGAESDRDVRNTQTTGDEGRKTMEKEDELTAKKSNRQQARSRSLARAF